jgi:nucleotide-binding universal stress UspA family protein
MARIVVGVDDSPGARAALAWAMREAELRHAELEVVHAWSLPQAEGWNREWPADENWFRNQATSLLERLVAEYRAGDSSAVQPILVPLECDVPATGLLEQSRGAELLVVGSRGRGGFTGLLLGSVSTQIVHHASGPVVVVHGPTA